MERKRIQLDVLDHESEDFKKLNVYVDGYCYTAYISVANYELMLRDGVFIRDGKTVDSAGIRNTTEIFYSDDRKEVIL